MITDNTKWSMNILIRENNCDWLAKFNHRKVNDMEHMLITFLSGKNIYT